MLYPIKLGATLVNQGILAIIINSSSNNNNQTHSSIIKISVVGTVGTIILITEGTTTTEEAEAAILVEASEEETIAIKTRDRIDRTFLISNLIKLHLSFMYQCMFSHSHKKRSQDNLTPLLIPTIERTSLETLFTQ